MQEPSDNHEQPAPQRAVVKRRWAVVPGAGAAVIAVAAVIALGDPADQGDAATEPSGSGEAQVSAEA